MLDEATTAMLLVMLLTGSAEAKRGTPNPCSKRGTSVVVRITDERLWLCDSSSPIREFAVALGSGGSGKAAAGDKKTPLGSYPLGLPRPSKEFGTFIPIGYPTEEQRKHGATGSDVGIHGPKRRFSWVGPINTWLNWTRGCIAVATDSDIKEIADWIRKKKPSAIHIE